VLKKHLGGLRFQDDFEIIVTVDNRRRVNKESAEVLTYNKFFNFGRDDMEK
jgi:hypothetical protein